ncbi:MAG: hypothetical protein ACYCW6_27190, partial [Candidatus Xenobia bacterium]
IYNPDMTRTRLTTSTSVSSTNVPGNSPNPFQIGSPLINVPWIAYQAPGGGYGFGVVGNPGIPPQPEGPFFQALAVWLKKQAAKTGTTFTAPVGPPGWENSYVLTSVGVTVKQGEQWILPPDATPGPPPNLPPPPTNSGPQLIVNHGGRYTFDLNQFLSPDQQLRVSLWQVL